eukprot:CAMPEP_0174882762 /NCGR_PEP_ID=MMETSP1114-20130205/84927_1 /TAXON_ID=312471 /ORGANISM="Neobodo designis, Strain CCAP 1951/1" /LENGTH=489 /DNA_ID=CAMNT_0016118163 /DNA_START=45 /DNA_END=1510 /DNA_ORIENTATION=+
MDHTAEYEAALARMTASGPHELDDSHRALNRAVYAEVQDVLPIDDIHKINDCDLIYRFLIAQRWHPQKAADALREYIEWREEMRLNEVLWEDFPPEVDAIAPRFHGTDRFGFPVFYDRPSPATVGKLLATVPRETLLRAHFAMMEQGRRLCKAMGRDRVTSVLDLALLNMSIVTNPSAVGLLKEFSHLDQKYYPENMRTMMLQNAGWTFGTLYKVIRPMLDERVQKKIQIMGTGDKLAETMTPWIDMDDVLEDFGGNSKYDAPPAVLQVRHLPVATPPLRPGETAIAEDEISRDEADSVDHTTPGDAAAPDDEPVRRPPTPPPPPPRPVVKRKVTEFMVHRSVTPLGVPASTAFVLGWPTVQRCGHVFVDAPGAVLAEIVRDVEGGLLVVDRDRFLRYRVVPPRCAWLRTSKLFVYRPRQPDTRVQSSLHGGAAVPDDLYLSMEVCVGGSGIDARDWSCVSHTRHDAPLLERRATHVVFRKELLSVPVA